LALALPHETSINSTGLADPSLKAADCILDRSKVDGQAIIYRVSDVGDFHVAT